MIYQKDWLMRQIEAMIAAILRFFFHTEEELTDVPEEAATRDELEMRARLDGLISEGRLCEAEDRLYEETGLSDDEWFRLAVHLYSLMNGLTDTYLEEHGFPREEIESGLEDACRRIGGGLPFGM